MVEDKIQPKGKDTAELVRKLTAAAAKNLQSVVLYGSAASGEFRPRHSDINILCLLRQINPEDLGKLNDAVKWWLKKGHPAPLVFTLEELRRSAGVYAIELTEIRSRRQILWGEDVFDSFDIPMGLYRAQVVRELRHNLLRLRQGYMIVAGKEKAVVALMAKSSSTFALLFRHALAAMGEAPPATKQDAVERIAALLGVPVTSFRDLFKVRSGAVRASTLDAELTFRDFLGAVSRAVDEIAQRLAS
ncbi:MAG: nucleotidyltransferase domain-containing protein [Acidobacteriota bacterium]|nr:nucleotidyltransferase domain-containing protein [Acidobacteriota bacterium]